MHRILFALTMALLLAGSAGEGMAYTLMACGSQYMKWASNMYVTSASQVGFPAGPLRDALNDVVSRWNNNPSLLRYSISYTDTDVRLDNDQSEVWWVETLSCNGIPNCPAMAQPYVDMTTCRFTEVDILFNKSEGYSTSTHKDNLWPYGGLYRPFQTTAMHEFGHAGGLNHTTDKYSIMGQDWTHIHTNGSTARAYPGEDAVAGMVRLYGTRSSAPEDLGVVHWRWTGSNNGYSTHTRTRIFSSSGVELSRFCSSAPGARCVEPVYKVSKGQEVQLELSYESLGKSSMTVAVGYYLSTDNLITPADRFLSSSSMFLSTGTVRTAKKILTIPTDLTSGQTYYLGAVVDYTRAISEANEDNNATYIGIRVQ